MKEDVICPLCKSNLGRYHNNASTKPLRDHTYESHPKEYQKIVKLIREIDDRYEKLKVYGVSHWSQAYYHENVDFENSLENTPPMSEEARKELVRKIMNQDEE